MENFHQIAVNNLKKAKTIIKRLDIENLWREIGAEVNLVGSVATGLLMKHRDIDFHIYTPELDLNRSFAVMAKLTANTAVKKVECLNLIDTNEECIEWHAYYEDEEKNTWQIDMIHIKKHSFFDGYAENVVSRLNTILTDDLRNTILKLKYDTPEDKKIMGILYYMAVIRDGVKTYAELTGWLDKNPVNEIFTWIP